MPPLPGRLGPASAKVFVARQEGGRHAKAPLAGKHGVRVLHSLPSKVQTSHSGNSPLQASIQPTWFAVGRANRDRNM